MGVGDVIQEVLDLRGMSQKELAQKLNIAPTTLSGYITNSREPDFATLKKIASILNVSIDYLFNYTNVADDGTQLSKQENSMLHKFRALKPEQKELITEQIDFMTRQNKMAKGKSYNLTLDKDEKIDSIG